MNCALKKFINLTEPERCFYFAFSSTQFIGCNQFIRSVRGGRCPLRRRNQDYTFNHRIVVPSILSFLQRVSYVFVCNSFKITFC